MPQVKKSEQDDMGLLLVPGEHHGQRQLIDPAFEGLGQTQRNADRRIGIVALPHIQEPWNAADVAELQPVEPVLAAGQGQYHAILGNLLRQICEIVATRFCPIATADEEKTADGPLFHRIHNCAGNLEDRLVTEADQDFLARILGQVGQRQGLFNHRRKVIPFKTLDAGPGHYPPGKKAVGIGRVRPLDAVGVENDCSRKIR